MLHIMIDFGRAQQRLGRDAAPVEANAAKILALDDCGLEAQLRRADRRNIAAGAGAEDDEVVVGVSHLHYSFLYKFNGRIQRIELPAENCSGQANRSEEHTSDLQSLMPRSYADLCMNKKH